MRHANKNIFSKTEWKWRIANVYMLAPWFIIDEKIVLGKLVVFEQ